MKESHKDYIKSHKQFIKCNNLIIEELQNEIDYKTKVLLTTIKSIDFSKERLEVTKKYSKNCDETFIKWCKENGYDKDVLNELNEF